MDMPMIDALAERVERLERENRRLKRIGAGLLIGTALTLIGAAGGAKVVEAERIVLSKDGTVRAVLGTDKEGRPSLEFLDEKGARTLLSLGIDEGGPWLNMRALDGEDNVGIGIAGGCPQFHLASRGRMVAMTADGGEEGSTDLIMYDDDTGGERACLSVRGGSAYLAFRPAKEKASQQLSIGAHEDGSMNLMLTDFLPDGKARTKIVLGGGPRGEAGVRVESKEGKTLLEVPSP